jgi:TatD family-associated radical SAM protein
MQFFDQFKNLFAVLLLIASVLAEVSGMPELCIAIILIVIINAVVGTLQEYRAGKVAEELKKKGARIRIDTDGQANLVYGRNILPELKGLVDSISVSLNAENAEKYDRLCRSPFGLQGFQGVIDFIREAKKVIPEVTATVVEMPGVDLEACRRLAEEELVVKFKRRAYDEVG